MDVKICTGAKCTLYGASGIIEQLEELQENLHEYPGIPADAVLNIEIIRCDRRCKEKKVSPLVFVDDVAFENAKVPELMEAILNGLEKEKA
ncbi:(2Fe-2S) ferredoxin domain-containing protein [Kallipyga massiliensis]|uniref:(2Fe-2S) ferredoxin domain-containing protein n=1 Tax=Kallipyga massiliensis TaxID=1472764 RepID=UPI0004AD9252|nr:(2Fe-2S) ferredoxin domain-containing protein [Kallipyga massiliensis]